MYNENKKDFNVMMKNNKDIPKIQVAEDKKTIKRYDILMIIWGLLLGVIEFLFIISGLLEDINISFIKAPFIKNLLLLAIISLCFRIITYIIQLPYKQKLKSKNQVMKNRHLALLCSIISITIMFFILWSIEMNGDPEGSLFSVIFLTVVFVAVQIPFLLPIL